MLLQIMEQWNNVPQNTIAKTLNSYSEYIKYVIKYVNIPRIWTSALDACGY